VPRRREQALTPGGTTSLRVQTRGGGRGGLTDGDLTISATRIDCGKGDATSVRPDGATVEAEKLEHLSMHPAIAPQSWDICFSHSLPWGQQSDCEATSVVPGGTARAMAPATGSMATDSVTKATIMARSMLMALTGLSAETPRGQVT